MAAGLSNSCMLEPKQLRLQCNPFVCFFPCDFSNYLDQVAEEINDTLQESGQVIISELSKTFTLSTDFLLEVRNTQHHFEVI